MTDKNEDSLENWKIEDLVPYENNPKLHSTDHINKLAANMQEVGFTQPIIVDKDGVIIAGHGRRMAAMRLGMKFVPVRVMRSMTPDKVKAARLSDNRLVSQEYNHEIEQAELAALFEGEEIDLSTLGYDERELEFLTSNLEEMDMSALVSDMNQEVEDHTDASEKRTKEVELEKVRISDAFGFSSVTTEMARRIGQFMGQVEEQTGEKGAAALDEFVSSLIS